MAPSWEPLAWFVFFWIVMPVLWYDRFGWFGVVLYLVLIVGLFLAARWVSCRVRRVPFTPWER